MEVEKIGTDEIFIRSHNGYICQFSYKGHDLIHGGGLPEELRSEKDNLRIKNGAPKYSNITVFPFGAIPEKVYVGGKEIINRDRHGLSRSLPWEDLSECLSRGQITFKQIHDGITPIKNIKYCLSKENAEILDPMFPFEIWRSYKFWNGNSFRSQINVMSEGDSFQYSLWDHPIFISPEDLKKGCFYFTYGNQERNKFNLYDVSKSERRVKLLDGIENITFFNHESGVGFDFKTKGFGNLMMWSPGGTGVFSIESKSHPGIEGKFPSDNSRFLRAHSSEKYSIDIIPFFRVILKIS